MDLLLSGHTRCVLEQEFVLNVGDFSAELIFYDVSFDVFVFYREETTLLTEKEASKRITHTKYMYKIVCSKDLFSLLLLFSLFFKLNVHGEASHLLSRV